MYAKHGIIYAERILYGLEKCLRLAAHKNAATDEDARNYTKTLRVCGIIFSKKGFSPAYAVDSSPLGNSPCQRPSFARRVSFFDTPDAVRYAIFGTCPKIA